jgi:amino acid adenylation domain-containing protein
MAELPIPAPTDIGTLVELLRWRAAAQPAAVALKFLPDGEQLGDQRTYGDLDRQARCVAQALSERIAPGERALLVYPPGLEFVSAFFGCLYAKVVAVPAYPPPANRPAIRLETTVASARPALALTTAKVRADVERRREKAPFLGDLSWLASDELRPEAAEGWRDCGARPGDLAFLQYTSGSTTTPRGVMLSHAILLHNSAVIARGFDHASDGRGLGVCWLPLYHDMGLIGGVLQPIFAGGPTILMPPVAFLTNPLRWLKGISDYRATVSGGPNFAYELCARKVTDEEKATLDLSSWEVAFTGAEPIWAETLDRFAEIFGPRGFRREAFFPCYGLAESTLMVTGSRKEDLPAVISLQKSALKEGRVVEAQPNDPKGQRFVGCGRPALGQSVVIADPQSLRRCAADEIGEIWTAGPSVAQGYWDLPEETEQVFCARLADGSGPYLRTGDLGFLHADELFVTGRIKDVLIIEGRNHYPQDIEASVEKAHRAVRAGCVAAFSAEIDGQERLIVAAELEREFRRGDPAPVLAAIRQAVAGQHGLYTHAVVLLRTGTIPMTSSGKVQRYACRDAFHDGTFEEIGRWSANDDPPPKQQKAGPAHPQRRAVQAFLVEQLARTCGCEASAADVTQPLIAFGLDSITAMALKARVECEFHCSLSISEVLREGASIQSLAEMLQNQCASSPAAALPEHVDTKEPALAVNQRAMWLLQQLEPESPIYIIALAARATGPLDVPALRHACQALVDRHPPLTTGFRNDGGSPRPAPRAHPDADFQVIGAANSSADDLQARLLDEANRPFDLEHDPLLRLRLFHDHSHGYTILLKLHHLIGDHRSLQVMMDELSALYAAGRSGAPAELPELSHDYGDFVRWQTDMLSGEAGEGHWSYWQQQLAGDLRPLDLPTDWKRPAVRGSRGQRLNLAIDAALARRLRRLAEAEGVTLFTLLLAALQALLHRHTGQDDILIGAPAAARARPEFDRVVGYFVNMIVLRSDLTGDPPFRTLLDQARRTVLEALEHQDFPFQLLVERLQPQRDPSRTPLFQVALALQKAGPLERSWRFGELRLEPIELERRACHFDLDVTIHDDGERLSGSIEFSTDLFDAESVERIWNHWQILLEALAADPARRLSELRMLPDAERSLIVAEWNRTDEKYPTACVQRLFEEQAAHAPEAAAIVDGSRIWTYQQLNERADRLARQLQECGIEPESLVGLLAPRSPEAAAGMLAVLKAGGAYVPLDPDLPGERLATMLDDARPQAVLTTARLRDRLTNFGRRIIALDEPIAHARANTEAAAAELNAHHPALVIFTSGSTGSPKGVVIEHGALSNYIHSAHKRFELSSADRVLQFSSLSFDVHAEEIFGALSAGAALVLRSPAMLDSPAAFWSECRALGITVAALPTAFWHELAAALGPGAEPMPPLRLLIVGGESMRPERLERWRQRVGPRVRLLNCYGPTEATIGATELDVTNRLGTCPTVPIGRPIANMRAYVLDQHRRIVPVGVPGELGLAGAGLARGYLNRPELTAEKFVEIALDGGRSERVYRTGDRTRWLPTGELEFLGRLDAQVKVRGFRMELGEIESLLVEHPQVREAAVLATGESGHGQRLLACVVGSNGRAPASAELHDYLKNRLPEYMVPAEFISVPAIPRTPGGKIDRRALPALEGSERHGAPAPARTGTEQVFLEIWREVLGLKNVGIHDDFFALGGHSLLALQVASRIRDRFGMELALREVFDEPTIAHLAARVDAARRAGDHEPLPPITRVARDGPLPLSFAQERLFFMDHLEPGSAFYNLPGAIRLHGKLAPDILKKALNEVVRRHETLRTSFGIQAGQPIQLIARECEIDLPLLDLSGRPAAQREPEVERLAREEARQPFDLARGPLLHTGLLRLAPDEHVLLATMHHIISDGWSVNVLIRETLTLYDSFSRGEPSPLPELPVQYADYALWQRRELHAEALERQLAYWMKQLAGVPALELSTARPRPSLQTFAGSSYRFELPSELSRGLHALARREGVTLFMTLLAAWQALLQRYTGRDDFAIGSPVAGRNRAELEGLIGFFVNALPLRADLSGDPSFRELLGRTRQVVLAALAHQDAPFEKLVEALAPARDPSRHPLFQALLVLQEEDLPKEAEPKTGSRVKFQETDSGTAKFDISLYLEESGGTIRGRWEFNSDLFDAATIERMHGHWLNLLGGAVSDPARRISELPLLGPAEQRRILYDWNGTAVELPCDDCLHHVFEQQAAGTPDARAVFGAGTIWTCRDLNERANRLAHHLRALGVGPEKLVGVCVERSPEMVLAMLGVLKAGGAYIPMDPAYPAERLAFTVADARPDVVITQSRLRDRLPAGENTVVLLDADWAGKIGRQPAENPAPAAGPDNAAYLLYTSGSTGQPKGVVSTHRATLNRFHWMWREFPFRPGEVCCQKTPMSFGDSIEEILGPVLRGVPLAIIADSDLKDPERLTRALRQHRIGRIVLVPTLLRMLLDHVPDLGERLPDLKLWIASGEVLDVDLAARFKRAMPHATVINMYGCSEASDDVTRFEVGDCTGLTRVPIGRPISNVQVYVLDRHLKPVPVGVPGELCIGGAGLARGYLQRPELTAEKFLPSPFGPPGSRLYRTGDRARWRFDGNLEYLGRLDQQVKLHGMRVELGEIETELAKHPNVKQAVVVARGEAARPRLVAYVVPHGPPAPAYEELRVFLKRRLPDYMLPAATVVLEALPLTPSGKVNRQALPEPERRPASARQFLEPRSRPEQILAGIWAELLHVQRVGADDNFFELGGESILALQMIARAAEAGLRISPKDLFQHQTVAELAAVAGDGKRSRPAEKRLPHPLLVPLNLNGDQPPLFCIHPIEGTVWGYAALARKLKTGQPIFGIRARGLAAGETPASCIEEMAAEYVGTMRTVQPAGPFFLCGWSMGGLIAYEMARRLEQEGDEVAFLAVLDQGSRKGLRPRALADSGQWASVCRRLDELPERPSERQIEMEKLRREPALVQLLPADSDEAEVLRHLRVFVQNWAALARYTPAPSVARVHLFRARDSVAEEGDPTLGWSALARTPVVLDTVPGDHRSMMRYPAARELARLLRKRLEAVVRSAGRKAPDSPRLVRPTGGFSHDATHTIAPAARAGVSDVCHGRISG